MHPTIGFVPQQQRRLATGAVEVRLYHLQNEAAGHRGIKGVAAAFKHAHGGL